MKISNKLLKNISFIYVFLPVFIFILFWIRKYISIPLSIICIIILIRYFKTNESDRGSFKVSKWFMLIVALIAALWCFLGGIAKLFYQPSWFFDNVVRNTMYRDLVKESFPVMYKIGNTNYSLCYYIGQWLVPAVISKLFLLKPMSLGSNIVLFLWCFWGVFLIFLWIIKVFKSRSNKKSLLIILSFILFSGLNIVGMFIVNGKFSIDQILNGFEWWNIDYQYSSFTSLLFWVYNQAIVPILITLMLYDSDDYKNSCCLLAFGVLSGPYPLLGLGIYMITMCFLEIIRNKNIRLLSKYFSIQNILSILFILPIFVLYYLGNCAIHKQSLVTIKLGPYILFVLLEFLLYVILIWKRHDKSKNGTQLYVVTFYLLVIPFLGGVDFIMRVSIPYLVILWILIIKFIENENSNKVKKVILIILLSISTISPLGECFRGIYCGIVDGNFFTNPGELDSIFVLPTGFSNNYVSLEDNSIFNKYILKEERDESN